MLKKLRFRIKGQSTAEYAILIALVVAAIIAMQTYAKRALQAKVRDASLYMVGQTNALGTSVQYEPYYLTSTFNTTRDQTSTQTLTAEGIGGVRSDSNAQMTRGTGGFQQFSFNTAIITSNNL